MAFSLTEVGDLASIVGLAVTIGILLTVRTIKKHYLFSARAPQLVRRLTLHLKSVSGYLNDYDTLGGNAALELRRTRATLGSIHRKLEGRTRKSVKRLMKLLDKHKDVEIGESEVRNIYLELAQVVEEIKDYKADQLWER